MSIKVADVRGEIRSQANEEIAAHSQRFFKTGPGEYGEGDKFLGIRVPVIRKLVNRFRDAPQSVANALLKSPYHEERLFGVLLLVKQYERGSEDEKARIYALYLERLDRDNNWDLIDGSAPQIVGGHLATRDRAPLYTWAKSSSLWERRIAIMATFFFIRQDDFGDTLSLAEMLLNDQEDLIHKAVGWMLREVGNRDRAREEAFLDRHYQQMPRTMLRYAIERLPERRRKAYLHGKV